MNSDPYADLPTATQPIKRPRDDKNEEKQPPSKRLESVASQPKPKEKQPLTVAQTITKLQSYMLVDKKFAKAAELFGKLLVEQCTAKPLDEDIMTALLETLNQVAQAKATRTMNFEMRNAYSRLFRLVNEHRDALLESPEYESDTIENWMLDIVVHNDLYTDDTYQFAKAAKAIGAHLDRREEAVANANEKDIQDIDNVLFPCIRTLISRHTTSWAKTSVEIIISRLTSKREEFSEVLRDEIDQWTQLVHQRKHAPIDKISAAAELRKNIVAYNDTQ
ncbi:hypothetical protein THRCLA_05333, partial [Thraustotheca clavata]